MHCTHIQPHVHCVLKLYVNSNIEALERTPIREFCWRAAVLIWVTPEGPWLVGTGCLMWTKVQFFDWTCLLGCWKWLNCWFSRCWNSGTALSQQYATVLEGSWEFAQPLYLSFKGIKDLWLCLWGCLGILRVAGCRYKHFSPCVIAIRAASVFSAREQSLLSHVDFVSHQNASRTLTVEVLQAFPTGASRSRPQASWRDYRSLLALACAIRSSRVSLGKTPFGLPCIACLCCDQDQIKGLKWLDRCMNRFIIECNHLKTFSHGMDAFE